MGNFNEDFSDVVIAHLTRRPGQFNGSGSIDDNETADNVNGLGSSSQSQTLSRDAGADVVVVADASEEMMRRKSGHSADGCVAKLFSAHTIQ